MPTAREMKIFCTNPATIKLMKEITATVTAYGIWVETWLIWLHWAPAEDIIVVSEIGEQWSPQTAPARQADMLITPRVLPMGKILRTIGIRIPKVPQEVPVAKAMKHAIIKIIAGSRLFKDSAEDNAF